MTIQQLYDFARENGLLDYVLTVNAEPFGFRRLSLDQLIISAEPREILI